MSATVTPKEIITALETSPEWIQQPAEMRERMQPFVSALPTVLADYLPQTVTLKGVLNAKIAFIDYCLDHDIVGTFYGKSNKDVQNSATNGDQVAPADENEESVFGKAIEMMVEVMDVLDPARYLIAIENRIKQLFNLIDNLNKILKENGLTERDVLTSEKIGITGEVLDLYDQGILTFADLLRLQPMVVIKND